MCEYCQIDSLGCQKLLTGKQKLLKGIMVNDKFQIKKYSDLFKQGKLIDEFDFDYCPKCGEKIGGK